MNVYQLLNLPFTVKTEFLLYWPTFDLFLLLHIVIVQFLTFY